MHARYLRITAAQSKHEVQRAFFLDVVVCERPAVFELLPGEYEALLVGRDALLVLDFTLDDVDGVGRLDLEGDRLAGERLDEYLHGCAVFVLNSGVCTLSFQCITSMPGRRRWK